MNRYLALVAVFGALVFGACSSDDGAAPEVVLSVSDFTATIPNLPVNGTHIGFVEANASNNVNPQFRLVSESVEGAFSIDLNSGRISVADGSLFDFEAHPTITATVEVMAGEVINAAAIGISLDELTEYQLEVVSYFKEIALGFEFGSASAITRKWRENMRVYVGGDFKDELKTELDLILTELEDLITDGFEIELVATRAESNYYIFLGSADEYASQFPSLASLIASNWGLFSINWDNEQYLNTGHMYVDLERSNDLEERHLLREEFTQSLGLARDSQLYPNSIFQGNWTRTTSYTDIDKELIRLLYHPDMRSGLSAGQVDELLREILTAD